MRPRPSPVSPDPSAPVDTTTSISDAAGNATPAGGSVRSTTPAAASLASPTVGNRTPADENRDERSEPDRSPP